MAARVSRRIADAAQEELIPPQRLPAIVPEGFDTGVCRSCRAPIMWGVSVDHRGVPKVNPRTQRITRVPLNVRAGVDGTWQVVGNGQVFHMGKAAVAQLRPDERRVGHHTTCPNVKQHRR